MARRQCESLDSVVQVEVGILEAVYMLGYFYASACKKVPEILSKAISIPLSAGRTGLNMLLCS